MKKFEMTRAAVGSEKWCDKKYQKKVVNRQRAYDKRQSKISERLEKSKTVNGVKVQMSDTGVSKKLSYSFLMHLFNHPNAPTEMKELNNGE